MTATGNSIVDFERAFNKLLEVYKTNHAYFTLIELTPKFVAALENTLALPKE